MLRVPRAERRGQDVDDAHDRLRVAGDRRRAAGVRPRPARSTGPKIRVRLGVVPQEDSLDTELTVFDNLVIYGRYFDLPRAVIRERAEELLGVHAADRSARRPCRPAVGRHEAPAHDRPCARQPARPAPARRAHHRPRPAGAPPAVGALLPTEAPGRHHRAHDALHGGGRAAVRPPRDHGRRAHRRRRIAARARRAATRRARSSSCASSTATRATRCSPRITGAGHRVEALPDRVLVYTDDGDAIVRARRERRRRCPTRCTQRRSTLEDVFLILTGRTLED